MQHSLLPIKLFLQPSYVGLVCEKLQKQMQLLAQWKYGVKIKLGNPLY